MSKQTRQFLEAVFYALCKRILFALGMHGPDATKVILPVSIFRGYMGFEAVF